MQGINSTASPQQNHSLPFHSALCPPLVSFTIWNLSKLGQPNLVSVSVLHLFYQDFGIRPNLRSIQWNLQPLILLCSALARSQELHSDLKCAPPTHVSWTCFNAKSGKYFFMKILVLVCHCNNSKWFELQEQCVEAMFWKHTNTELFCMCCISHVFPLYCCLLMIYVGHHIN